MSAFLEAQLAEEKAKNASLLLSLEQERSRRILAEDSLRSLQHRQELLHQQGKTDD